MCKIMLNKSLLVALTFSFCVGCDSDEINSTSQQSAEATGEDRGRGELGLANLDEMSQTEQAELLAAESRFPAYFLVPDGYFGKGVKGGVKIDGSIFNEAQLASFVNVTVTVDLYQDDNFLGTETVTIPGPFQPQSANSFQSEFAGYTGVTAIELDIQEAIVIPN